MTLAEHNEAVKELMKIPGVTRAVADDLVLMSVKKTSDLINKNALRLYATSNRNAGKTQNHSLLQVFEEATAYAHKNNL